MDLENLLEEGIERGKRRFFPFWSSTRSPRAGLVAKFNPVEEPWIARSPHGGLVGRRGTRPLGLGVFPKRGG